MVVQYKVHTCLTYIFQKEKEDDLLNKILTGCEDGLKVGFV